MNFFQKINPATTPRSLTNEELPVVLRERILQYGLLGISIIGTILIPTIMIFTPQKWYFVAIYSFALLSILSITIFRNIPLTIRTYVFSGLFLLIAITDLLGAGLSSDAHLFLISFIVLSTLLVAKNNLISGIISIIISLIITIVIGLGMTTGWITPPSVEVLTNTYIPNEWIVRTLVFLLLSVALVSTTLMISNQMKKALDQQQAFTQELGFARSKLQEEFDQQKEEVNRRASELEAASALARNISRFTNLDNLLSNSANLIRDQFGFYHAGIFLLDTNKEFAVLQAATGDAGRQMLANNHRLRVGEVGLVGYAVSKGETRIAQDVYQDATHYKNPILPDTRSEIALPLRVAGNIIGALDVQSTEELAFQPEDIKILQMIADQLAVAINKAQLLQQLQKNVEDLETRYRQSASSSWGQFLESNNHKISMSFSRTTQEINETAQMTDEEKNAISEKKTILVSKDSGKADASTQLSVPLMLRDNMVLGALRIEFNGQTVPKQTVEMLENISTRLAVALDRARLMNEIQSTAEQDRLITDVTAKIRSSSNIDNILKTAASEIGRSLGASEVIVQLLPTDDK